MADSTATENAVKLVGEVMIPGGSLLVDGDFKSGALHFLGSAIIGSMFGPIGLLAVSANAYSKAISKDKPKKGVLGV